LPISFNTEANENAPDGELVEARAGSGDDGAVPNE
jgi:hypothetical protein